MIYAPGKHSSLEIILAYQTLPMLFGRHVVLTVLLSSPQDLERLNGVFILTLWCYGTLGSSEMQPGTILQALLLKLFFPDPFESESEEAADICVFIYPLTWVDLDTCNLFCR